MNPYQAAHAALLALMLAGSVCAQAQPSKDAISPALGPKADIRMFRGAPALFINNVPQSGMMSAGFNIENAMVFTNVGVKIYMPISTASQGFWAPPVWISADHWDYTAINDRLKRIAATNRYAIIRLELSAPTWWREQHPNEMVKTQDTNGIIKPLLLPLKNANSRTVPSWASTLWLHDTGQALAHLVQHIESSPYAQTVIGYMICSGESHEWFEWGGTVDFSNPNIDAFRLWLSRQYATEAAFQQAWKTNLSIGNAWPPTDAKVNTAELGSLRDPGREQPVIDYLQFLSDRTANAVETLCGQVKQAAKRPVIVGTFYGYLNASDPRWGHQALGRILNSPNVDFLAAPTSYWEHRRLGVAAPAPMAPLGSVSLHGKYWISETDLRTSLTGAGADWFQQKVPDTDADIIWQRREMAWIFTSGVGQWWFDVGGIRYDSPALMKELGNLVQTAEKIIPASRIPEAKAAAILDPNSALYIRPRDALLNETRRLQIDLLQRSGLAAATYSSDDLAQLDEQRLFLFCDMIAPDEALRKQIDRLKSAGRVLVFQWAAGAVSSHEMSEPAMETLTGIHLRRLTKPVNLTVTLNDGGGLVPGMKGKTYGCKRVVSPVFTADDPNVEIWGTLDSGEPGLVVRRYRDWTAVYSSSPLLPAEVLAALGKLAKAHQYIRAGDALWATKGLLGIHAFSPGVKRIEFEKSVRLYDLYEQKDLGAGSSFEVPFKQYETHLFRKEE